MPTKSHTKHAGFTLIEVLLALAIIAIALTALLQATAQNIENTHRIKTKNIMHWAGMQAVTLLQLHLVSVTPESTQVTTLLGLPVYWRVTITPTSLESVEQLTLFMSPKQTGPFLEELTAFRYNA